MRNQTILAFALVVFAACSDDGIDSNEEARRAYYGLDRSIAKSLNLGFQGYNTADNANIDPQTADGDDTGTVTIDGQVDAGSSDNKTMHLTVAMVDYSDGVFEIETEDETVEVDLTYDTDEEAADQPQLELKFMNVPDGDFTGTLVGTYYLTGDIDSEVELDLTMSGDIQSAGGELIERVTGTTTITGTATSGDGHYDVEITL